MVDFRISYTDETDLLAYARNIGFVDQNGELMTQGPLPDSVGSWFMTGPFSVYAGSDGNLSENAWITPPDHNGLGGVPAALAGYGRTLRINGNNPFVPEGSLPLPDPSKVVIWPPNDSSNPGYIQPEYAVIA